MDQRLWIIDDAIAIVDDGSVTLQISQPTRHLPRKDAENVADKAWFKGQMRQLEVARQKGETKEIPLTNRRKRSSIRLGGGFLITQGTKIIVPQRNLDASRPGQLCVCGGVYEYIQTGCLDLEKVQNDVLVARYRVNDYVASLFKESQEVALRRDNILYVPQLAPYSTNEIDFQPPGTLEEYNEIMQIELKKELAKVLNKDIQFEERKFRVKVLDYDHAVRLEFGYSPALSVEIVAEIDTSSLECFGVLSYPENIEEASKAYLEEEKEFKLKQYKKESQDIEKEKLDKEIADITVLLGKIQKDIEDKNNSKESKKKNIEKEIEFWDCDMGLNQKQKEEGPPIHRDILVIDTKTDDVKVWYCDGKSNPDFDV